ncbi:MAG: type IV pilus secretin PilQ [Candidatus Eiseniibacteriota bacterium]|jgi:type IV pilus assembly protein PilQ
MKTEQQTQTRTNAVRPRLGTALILAAVTVAAVATTGVTPAEAGVLEDVVIDTHDQVTRVGITTRGEVTYSDFSLRNPDRLVLDFSGSTSQLPPRLPQSAMGGLVRDVKVSVWDREGEEPATRLIFELARRASYSIAQQNGSVVVALESGAPSASDLGYDEDRLATTASTRAPANPAAVDDATGEAPSVYGGGVRLDDRPTELYASDTRRVSLDVQRANVLTVVRTLGQLSGRNIVTNADVSGQVTLRLDDLPWPQALDIVLLTQGLGFTDEEGVIRIASIDALRREEVEREEAARRREELLPIQTIVVPVEFAKAAELKPSLGKMLSTRGHAEVDERTNSLIITDISEKLEMARGLVTELDTRTPQVEIEARLIDLDVSAARDVGIDWTLAITEEGAGDLGTEQVARSINPIANPAGELRVGAIRDNWTADAVIQALVNDRKANIISNPRITTVNNREASILVGQEIPLIVQDEAFNSVIQLKQIGIKLSVRPHINSDRQIELDIHPEVSDLASQATVQGGIIINTSEADTRVLVGDGETAVIGGLIRENDTVSERGIPVLKDIPAVGWLFKSTSKVKQKRELLIFITPRIVEASAAR